MFNALQQIQERYAFISVCSTTTTNLDLKCIIYAGAIKTAFQYTHIYVHIHTVHIYVYKTAQCIARIGVNDMHNLCGQQKTRCWTML